MRVYGYIRASELPEIESPQVQHQMIAGYCRRVGREVDGFYADVSGSGKLSFHRREAGGRLFLDLRRGDHVVLARLDRLADSFLEAAFTLDDWARRGIVTHVLDIPGCCLDPGNPETRTLIELTVAFARYWREMIGTSVKESFVRMKRVGRRCSRFAPYGYRWERRGKKTFAVPDPTEQVILRRVVELREQGYSLDQIRQYLNYEWKVRNREGNEFGSTEVRNMAIRGAEMLATAAADTRTTESVSPGSS
jgi:DNA invertase Pin-like site-specific DNA recombinase